MSALWALSPDPWIRAEVLAAHDAAVDAALGWFDTHGAVTRRGRDGLLQVDTQGVAVAVFRQHTSRSVDPQLHTHAVIAAKVQDRSGRWLSLDARFLKYQQRTIGWIYDAALRTELTTRLGVAWNQAVDEPSDMGCVPETVRDVLSQRSAQVADKLADLIGRWSAENDGAEPDPRTIALLERRAARTSRPSKSHPSDPAGLHEAWRDLARGVGFDPDQLTVGSIAGRIFEQDVPDEELIAEALRRVADEQAAWLRADIARHLTTIVAPGDCLDAVALVDCIDELAARADALCRTLGPDRRIGTNQRRDGRPLVEHVTDRLLTTPAVLDEETRLQAWAERHARPIATGGSPQRSASDAIGGHDRLVVLVGPAGTGKTRTIAAAVRALDLQHRPVVGLAPSGKAADVLRAEAGCDTDTVAGFLARHQHRQASPWPAGTTVVLDEAAMVRTTDLAALVDLIERHGWRLVAVGDPAQLPAVGRGGVFAHWSNTVPHHRLDTPRRFSEPWEAAASIALRAGNPTAIDFYDQHGRLHTTHPALVATTIADHYATLAGRGHQVGITTNTAETARAINIEIQHRLTRLDPQRHRYPTRRLADRTNVMVGDQIATRHNDRRLVTHHGEAVRNRHTWEVTDLHPDGSLTVAHPDRGTVTLPARYVDQHVQLGWATTGYGNQGDTVDIGLAVLEAGTTRNHAYVALTRGRHANHAWIPDPTGTTNPADALAEIIGRTPRAASALATREALHQAAGIEVPTTHGGGRPARPATPPAASRTTPAETSPPAASTPAPSELDEKVAAMQARLDRLQGAPTREAPDLGRGLSR